MPANISTISNDSLDEKILAFNKLVNNDNAFNFFIQVINESYCEFYNRHKMEVGEILDLTFNILIENKHDLSKFIASTKYISETLFKKDENHWFYSLYKNYKRNIKPNMLFTQTKSLIYGNRLLDFGCGDGLFSFILKSKNFDITAIDIIDYRDKQAKNVNFINMNDIDKIPLPDDSIDTTFVFTVFHHISIERLFDILNELNRISKRIIVVEDCYEINNNLASYSEIICKDDQFRRYVQLSNQDQLDYLKLMDFFGNVLIQGIYSMNIPYCHKTVNEWEEDFQRCKFKVISKYLLGFQNWSLNRNCQVIFVLEKTGRNSI